MARRRIAGIGSGLDKALGHERRIGLEGAQPRAKVRQPMSNPLAGIDLTRWWAVLIALGTLTLLAGVAGHDRGMFAVGLGLAAIGLGEMINNPKQVSVDQFMRFTIEGHPRRNYVGGLLVDFLGAVVLARGLWLLLA